MEKKRASIKQCARKRVMIVEDHPITRDGLAQLINQQEDLFVCYCSDSISDAINSVDVFKPDVAIVDLSLGGASGLELIKSIKKRQP